MAIKSEFIKTLTKNDFTIATTVAVLSTKYVDIASQIVPPKQRIFVGHGKINLGVDDRGTYKADINTTAPADIPGVTRILLRDANAINSVFLREDLSVDYETGVKVGKGGKTGNEQNLPFVTEDEVIIIQMMADSGATMTKADSTIYLPVTIQAL